MENLLASDVESFENKPGREVGGEASKAECVNACMS
jgi:hypothetical protein